MPLIILKQDGDEEKRDYILLTPEQAANSTYPTIKENQVPYQCAECDRSLLWGTKCSIHDVR